MPNNIKTPFSPKNICNILIKQNLISPARAKEILASHDTLRKTRNEKINEKGLSSFDSGAGDPVSIIDEITSLNLTRANNKERIVDEDIITLTLSRKWEIPYKKIDPLRLDLNLVTTTIPRTFARRHLVVPIGIKDGALIIAAFNPFNKEVLDDISKASRLPVKVVISSKTDIIKLIDEFFGFKSSIAAAERQFSGPAVDLGNLEHYVKLKSAGELPSNDHHIVNAVNHLFSYGFDQRASDIHIEPKRDTSRVRMRIDGLLHTIYNLPKKVHSAVTSRIKSLSRIDIAEKRRPQDGRIKIDNKGVEVEIRVSTIPVAFGEKIVMRIMDPDVLFQPLEKLGFTSTDLISYNKIINMPHGILLVCGPTGSGKSTTLYSTLRYLNSEEVNITTVEDPIEMIHEDFNQISVQMSIGVTFSSILRHILRQDPDIIMIGEMRDLETAENATQAAMTGHLVLSTLHTNDSSSAITRLIELGVPSFLIQSTIIGIISQRLVRTICSHCAEYFEIDAEELMSMGLDISKKGILNLRRGKGCANCRGTGYYGRTSIFEILPYTEPIMQLTTPKADIRQINMAAKAEGMVTMRENAIKKMLKGETTYQEVLKVTWNQT